VLSTRYGLSGELLKDFECLCEIRNEIVHPVPLPTGTHDNWLEYLRRIKDKNLLIEHSDPNTIHSSASWHPRSFLHGRSGSRTKRTKLSFVQYVIAGCCCNFSSQPSETLLQISRRARVRREIPSNMIGPRGNDPAANTGRLSPSLLLINDLPIFRNRFGEQVERLLPNARAGFPFRAATLFPSERGYFVFEKRCLGKHDSIYLIYLITITQLRETLLRARR
jgi:hypothetical protein